MPTTVPASCSARWLRRCVSHSCPNWQRAKDVFTSLWSHSTCRNPSSVSICAYSEVPTWSKVFGEVAKLPISSPMSTWPTSSWMPYVTHRRPTAMTTTTDHRPTEPHDHTHGPMCGHEAVIHLDHVDYLHNGHAHREHSGHYDECSTCACASCSDVCAFCTCATCTCVTCNHTA